ncbi:DUF3558 domain-containing protein [Actinophytocola gossypii]|uniref:DUF3558 family protein n=1 Tax=Actinophytocola gossypii TaxID=2812003 RepID=A0ABT2JB83_9PSEU|nr:DUF3558 domain-containing protein [Actinophytocola gossypii]MCT2585033.1 DUF3558 family protein [Actinophytocola gossypii]
MRGLLLLVAVAVLAVGCGAEVDTTKVTYPRTTVPAGELPAAETRATGTPRTNDPAFAPEKLRAVDPCALLDPDLLGELGSADDNVRNDFDECANYMEDDEGNELNLTLTVGDKVSNAVDADQNIGGLPAVEDDDIDDACFVSVVTSTSPNFGITVQASGETGDLCAAGRTLLTGVVDRVRTDPPRYDLAKGTLIEVDPCTLLEGESLGDALGGAIEPTYYNLHWCSWSGTGASLGVWLRIGPDPAASGTPVDLGGGITGYQEKTVGATASCSLDWQHRPSDGDDVEIVSLEYDDREPAQGEDPCATTVAVAKKLLPALPKP